MHGRDDSRSLGRLRRRSGQPSGLLRGGKLGAILLSSSVRGELDKERGHGLASGKEIDREEGVREAEVDALAALDADPTGYWDLGGVGVVRVTQ